MGDDSTGVRAGFEGDGEKGMSSRMGEGGYTPRNVEGEAPVFVSVASKGLKARVGSGQWTVREGDEGAERWGEGKERGEGAARRLSDASEL